MDFGCATGSKTLEFADYTKKMYGIDFSKKMIEIAQKNAALQKAENVEFSKATLFDNAYQPQAFDVILAFNMLHGLRDTLQIMQRIGELLKPGGLFISVTPCMKEKMSFVTQSQLSLFLLFMKLRLIPNVLTRYTHSELVNLIASADFQIIETKTLYNWMSNYYIVAKKPEK